MSLLSFFSLLQVSVLNSIDTAHEDMIVSHLKVFTPKLFASLVISHAFLPPVFFSKPTFSKKFFSNTINMSFFLSIQPDTLASSKLCQTVWIQIRSDILVPNCLHNLSAIRGKELTCKYFLSPNCHLLIKSIAYVKMYCSLDFISSSESSLIWTHIICNIAQVYM